LLGIGGLLQDDLKYLFNFMFFLIVFFLCFSDINSRPPAVEKNRAEKNKSKISQNICDTHTQGSSDSR